MSEITKLKEAIQKIKASIDNPKTDAKTKQIFKSALEKGEKKLAELERVNKMKSSNKELTDTQEKKVDQVKESSSALAAALKQKVAAAKAKIAKTKPKPTAKKKKGVSVAKAKNIAKKIRGNQRLSQSDLHIESDAKRFAINKTKRKSQGGRANQYGTKAQNKGGIYYEKRDNRYDRQNKKYAKLEDGGIMAKGGGVGDNVLRLNKGDIYKIIDKDHTETGNDFVFIDYVERGKKIVLKSLPFPFNYSRSSEKLEQEVVYVSDITSDGIKLLTNEQIGKIIRSTYGRETPNLKDGGMMAKGGMIFNGDKVEIFDNLENYDGYEKGEIMEVVGNDFVTFYDVEGNGKSFSVSEKDIRKVYADGGMMAKGGRTKKNFKVGDKVLYAPKGKFFSGNRDNFKEGVITNIEEIGKLKIKTYTIEQKNPFGNVINTIVTSETKEIELNPNYEQGMADGGAIAELNRGLNSDFRFDIHSENFAKGGSMADDAVEITGFGRNIMGTLDITMRLKAMRKPQEFIVYPVSMGDKEIMIQSDTRIGRINMSDGTGKMSQSHPNGAYGVHFSIDKLVPFKLTDSQLSELKSQLAKTAGKEVGTKGVISNNEGAAQFMAQGGLTEHGLQVGDRIVRMTNDPYTIVVDNMGVESVVDLNEGTRKGGQGTRFMSSGMMASGGEVHLKKKIDALTGKRVHYEALGGVGGSFQIQSATISPEFYSKRYVHIHSKGGGVDSFPLSELDEFMKGREVEVRDSKGEPYTLQLLSKMEDGGSIISEDTVARVDDPRLADVSAYMEGGELKDVGGTQFSTRDLSGMFANGGVVSYVGKDDRDQSYFRRYNGAIGSFQWQIDSGKNRRFAEGILYPLSDFDRKYYSHIKLRDGELLLRYKTDIMRSVNPNRGEGEYLIKINLDNGMIYFMSDADDDDDKNPKFETRGIKAKYIRITSDYAKKLEDGGNLEMVKNQAVEVGHHSEELKDALKKDPKVDAWVVSKMGNLTGELSDVTHYLDGQTKSFMSGGMLNKSVNDNLKLYLYEKKGSPMHQWMVKTILAAALTDANFHSASKKAETIFPEAKFTESVQYSKLQEESLIDRLEEKGREIARLAEWDGEQIINAISFYTSMNMGHPLGLKVASLKNSMAYGGMMAMGGEIRRFDRHEQMDSDTRGEILDTINEFYLIDGFRSLQNYLYGLFDGYDYSQTDAFKKDMEKLKSVNLNLFNRIENIFSIIDNYSFYSMADGGMMARGGKVKFSDKVKSISQSLLKRKKVSPSVQKDYGKTYSKKEAVESAKRIAGAMRKKETAKKKR